MQHLLNRFRLLTAINIGKRIPFSIVTYHQNRQISKDINFNDINSKIEAAKVHLQHYRLQEGNSLLNEADTMMKHIGVESKPFEYLYCKILYHIKVGETTTAQQIMESIKTSHPQEYEKHEIEMKVNMFCLLQMQSRYKECINYAENNNLLSINQNDDIGLFICNQTLSRCYYELNELKKAESFINNALNIDLPDIYINIRIKAVHLKGRILLGLQQFNEAELLMKYELDQFEKSNNFKLYEDRISYLYSKAFYAEILYNNNKYDEAKELAQTIYIKIYDRANENQQNINAILSICIKCMYY